MQRVKTPTQPTVPIWENGLGWPNENGPPITQKVIREANKHVNAFYWSHTPHISQGSTSQWAHGMHGGAQLSLHPVAILAPHDRVQPE